MRVPIENGSGLSTRVSDSIKLSAAYRNSVYKDLNQLTLSYFKLTGGCFFIA